MNQIETLIQEAKREGDEYLDSEVDGGAAEHAPSDAVWKRIEAFLHAMSVTAVGHALDFDLPDIDVCANGSVDLYWKKGYALLINFHETGLGYYGDTKDAPPGEECSQSVKGTLKSVEDPRRLLWMLFWMRDMVRK